MKLINVTTEKVRLFNTLSIETGSMCNRKCKFCFHRYYKRPDEFMSQKILDKIYEELRVLKYNGRIELQNYNEPIRDKRLPEIIRSIKEAAPRCSIMINTNGDYIKDKEVIKKLFKAGLNQMAINCYDDNKERRDRMVKYCMELKDELDLQLGEGIYHHSGKRIVDVVDKSKFIEEGNRSLFNYKKLDKKYNNINNNGGALVGKIKGVGKPNTEKLCVLPFRKATIRWDGNVILCCQHPTGEVNFGNLMDNTIIECWNSEIANFYRLHLQNKQRNHLIGCNKCSHFGGFYQHMISKITFGEKKDKELLKISLI
ncbi:MAG TPA: SPASM domain-containing protein [Candidatus Kapabacteria bacterium]|nr:SPASM domain-containing protein [Candidatus Kapabacteria bacterium]